MKTPDSPPAFRAAEGACVLDRRPLWRNRGFAVWDVVWDRERHPAQFESPGPAPAVLFLHEGSFLRSVEGRTVVADATSVSFYRSGERSLVRHAHAAATRGTRIVLEAPLTQELSWAREESARSGRGESGGRLVAPVKASTSLRLRATLTALHAGEADPLATDDTLYRVLAETESPDPPSSPALGRRRVRSARRSDRLQERIREIQSWIASDPARPVRLEDLAQCAGCTPWHFSRTFAEVAGTSLVQYVKRLRLHIAVERICAGADDLATVALDSGFASHSHLSASFRAAFGTTPTDFRRVSFRRSPPVPGVLHSRARI